MQVLCIVGQDFVMKDWKAWAAWAGLDSAVAPSLLWQTTAASRCTPPAPAAASRHPRPQSLHLQEYLRPLGPPPRPQGQPAGLPGPSLHQHQMFPAKPWDAAAPWGPPHTRRLAPCCSPFLQRHTQQYPCWCPGQPSGRLPPRELSSACSGSSSMQPGHAWIMLMSSQGIAPQPTLTDTAPAQPST